MQSNTKITKEMIENINKLTPLQEGMLFHYLKNPHSDQYFEQLCLEVSSEINIEAFKKAWNTVVENNEMLRTIFKWKKIKHPVQMTLKRHDLEIFEHDISDKDNKERDKLLEKIKKEDKENKFDLEYVPFRIILCKLEQDKYQIIISNHHIIFDGWSTGIIIKEFLEFYEAFNNGNSYKIPTKNKIKEFIKYIQAQDNKKQKQFWKEYLENFKSNENIAIKINENQNESGIGKFKFKIDDEIKREGEKLAKEQRITFASLLYSVWGILLNRYKNSDDIVFGTTVSGRNAKIKGIENMVGLFINTLPLRIKTTKNDGIIELLKNVNHWVQERQDYESSSLVEIKEASGLKNDEELFDSLVVIENYPLDKVLIDNGDSLSIKGYSIFEETNFHLTVGIEMVDDIEVTFTYNKDKFSYEAISKIGEHFENIFRSIVYNSDETLDKIEMISNEEKHKLLYTFNDTEVNYPLNNNICQLFEKQVKENPDNIAIVYKDNKLTYRELNEKSNSLARVLREKGIEHEDIIGIMIERSLERIIAIFGVLKAGAAYLPIDPNYPEDRIKYMIEDSGCKLLLTKTDLAENIEYNKEIIDINNDEIYTKEGTNLEIINQPDNLAYIIYTSGSTGKPKGVMIEHRNIINTIKWRSEEYKLSSKDNVLQLFSFSFDGFLTSFFTPIVSGAKVTLLDEYESKNPLAINNKIWEDGITHFICVPSLYDAILECSEDKDLNTLQTVTLAGERLTNKLIEKSKDKQVDIEIVNEYGPTENSVATTICRDLKSHSKVTIGKPIANTKVYILDRNNNLVPLGVAGELCISGNGLARGYLNRTELTEEKFIKNPFNSEERLYKTGDLARWIDEGEIDFIGRIDNQVKIRGYRIELGEIEKYLLNYDYINEAIVIAKERENKDKYLCSYIVINDREKELEVTELRESLSKELPDYMIPTYFIKLDKLPITPNGKVDRKALPEPDGKADTGVEYELPRNKIEEKLVKMWEEILGVNNVGINDNFFSLGGHSLKLTKLISKIHKELDIEIPLNMVYEKPSIKEISKYIVNSNRSKFNAIKPVNKKEYYPLSSAQKRMYVSNKFNKESTNYNMQIVLKIDEKIKREEIEIILNKLIDRHESFRTSFELVDKEPMQKIHEEVNFSLNHVIGKEENVEKITEDFIRPFDLSKVPLIRGKLVQIEEGKHILILDMHHIISDEMSLIVLISEFMKLYNNQELPKLTIQYKDYATWQNKIISSEELKSQEEYWLSKFKGDIPILEIQTDYEKLDERESKGNRIRLQIPEKTLDKLRQISSENGATLYTILLEIYGIFLYKYTGQEDIIIGTPSAGRTHADLQNIIGMFVNTIPLRLYPKGEENFTESLVKTRKETIESFQNQDYQLEVLVKKLRNSGSYDRDSLFDTLFSYHTMTSSDSNSSELEFLQYDLSLRNIKFDLILSLIEMDKLVDLEFQYDTSIFKRETVERMSKHFIKIVETVADNPSVKIKDISILDEDELNNMVSKTKHLKKEINIDFDF